MRHTRLANESEAYLSKWEELQSLEIESMKLRERVAEARRQLPQGPAVKDYLFLEGPPDLNGGDSPTSTLAPAMIQPRCAAWESSLQAWKPAGNRLKMPDWPVSPSTG